MITVKKQFLTDELMTRVTNILSTNENDLKNLTKEIKHSYSLAFPQNHWTFAPLTFKVSFYSFRPGTDMKWHFDNTVLGSIIYLNKEWDINDGGLFMYKLDNGQILAEVPEYNKMLLDYGNCEHAVSTTKKRLDTLLVFGEK